MASSLGLSLHFILKKIELLWVFWKFQLETDILSITKHDPSSTNDISYIQRAINHSSEYIINIFIDCLVGKYCNSNLYCDINTGFSSDCILCIVCFK